MKLQEMTQETTQETTPMTTNGVTPLPVDVVPMPTIEYRLHRKSKRVTYEPAAPPVPTPAAAPTGSRALIWKQDPSVKEVGIRPVYLPGLTLAGPRDARVTIQGLPPVSPNALGDFIQTPGTPAFDCAHTFTIVRQTLTLCQRARNGAPLPWQWNPPNNTDPLKVYPHGLADVPNAFYSRSQKALKFGHFIRQQTTPPQRVYTCRSFDIVAHETGHAILDGLKPGWIFQGNPPQTGGLHESFGDLVAIFLALAQMDQVEAIIAQTKADLHDKNFLADLAEEFGLALGRPNGLRNADNNLKLSQVGTEVHAISQVFTGGVYDVLADIFAFERNPARKDDAQTLFEAGQYLFGLALRAIIAAPATGATYANVVNQMLSLTASDGKPVQYRNFIRNQFSLREVVVAPTPLTEDHEEGLELAAGVEDAEDARQNRHGCCGTMRHPEYAVPGYREHLEEEEVIQTLLQKELDDLKRAMQREFRHSSSGETATSGRARK